MIYTVTLNPSLDRTLRFSRLAIGELNRAKSSRTDLSGKGVNVSLALRQFSLESVAVGLAGGVSGRILVEGLRAGGLRCDFTPVAGEARANITAIDESSGLTTKLNEPGPLVSESELGAFEGRLLSQVSEGDLCVFSGNLPPGAPDDTYARLIAGVHARGARAALDSSGRALALGCAARPDLLKPNAEEAAALVGRSLDSATDWMKGIEALLDLGAQRVLLSLGAQGAALGDGYAVWLGEPPAINEVSAVGAGDSLMAAALWAWMQGMPAEQIVRWAVAAGTAAAMEDGSAVPSFTRVQAVCSLVSVRRLGGRRD